MRASDTDAATEADARSDAQVIDASRGDPEQFAAIFDKYFEPIYRYAAVRLGPATADDVAAETFLVAFRRRSRYDPALPSARAWLYGIATNLINRHRRAEVRLYRALERTGADRAAECHANRVSERVSAAQLQPRLAAGLAALPAGDRDVLLLVGCGGLSYEEVAAALKIPAGTVGSRLNRGRRRLRAALDTNDGKEIPHG